MFRQLFQWLFSWKSPVDLTSVRLQELLHLSRGEADRLRHDYVGTEHLLLGLLEMRSGRAIVALRRMQVDLVMLKSEVERLAGVGHIKDRAPTIPASPMFQKVLRYGQAEARRLGQDYLDTEHVLLGLLRAKSSVGGRALVSIGVSLERGREVIAELNQGSPLDRE